MNNLKNRIFSCMSVGIFVLFVVVPCFLSAKEYTLLEADNGACLSLDLRDTLNINLVGNQSAGFSWKIAVHNGPSLKFVEHRYTLLPSVSAIRVGGPGLFSFKFLAIAQGPTELQLVYSRPWEKDIPPAKVFKVRIDVDNRNCRIHK